MTVNFVNSDDIAVNDALLVFNRAQNPSNMPLSNTITTTRRLSPSTTAYKRIVTYSAYAETSESHGKIPFAKPIIQYKIQQFEEYSKLGSTLTALQAHGLFNDNGII
jgi:hypothetical protein